MIKSLTGHILDNACILAYNMQFEKGVLDNLAKQFPEYSKKLMGIHNNMIDLMAPFRSKNYYTKEMKGSYSLKYVLPALVPELRTNLLKYCELDTYAMVKLLERLKE